MGLFPFSFDCPHCWTKNIAFVPRAGIPGPMDGQYDFIATCKEVSCNGSVLFNTMHVGAEPSGRCIKVGSAYCVIENSFPQRALPGRISHLPEKVRTALDEAEATLGTVSPRIARGAFRTVLDEATREALRRPGSAIDEEALAKMALAVRLDKLAALQVITRELRDWAHGLRAITNDDVHTVETVTAREAAEVAEIARLLLIYLYDLPGRVAAAKEAAGK